MFVLQYLPHQSCSMCWFLFLFSAAALVPWGSAAAFPSAAPLEGAPGSATPSRPPTAPQLRNYKKTLLFSLEHGKKTPKTKPRGGFHLYNFINCLVTDYLGGCFNLASRLTRSVISSNNLNETPREMFLKRLQIKISLN